MEPNSTSNSVTPPNDNDNDTRPLDSNPIPDGDKAAQVNPDEVPEPDETLDNDTGDDNGDEVIELSNGDTLDYDDDGYVRRTDARTQSVHVADIDSVNDLRDVVVGLHKLYPDKF